MFILALQILAVKQTFLVQNVASVGVWEDKFSANFKSQLEYA